MRQDLNKLRQDVERLAQQADARAVAEQAGPPAWEQVQSMLADPAALAAELAWDSRHLGDGGDVALGLTTLDEALAADPPYLPQDVPQDVQDAIAGA